MKNLKGKTALLTGASKGIGVYLARALADRGMNLVLAARSADALGAVKKEVEAKGVRAIVVPTDVGDRAALQALADKAIAEFGGVDVLVNNAGVEQGDLYMELGLDAIDEVLSVNLNAPMLLTRMLLPQMVERGSGHIVNISSLAGMAGVPYNETYSASKHGLIGFGRSLRATFQAENVPVEVSSICPGFVADAGMYHDMKELTGIPAPELLGTSPPETVAAMTLRAIDEGLPEVLVTPKPFKPLALAVLLFPKLDGWIADKTGATEWFRAVWQKRSELGNN